MVEAPGGVDESFSAIDPATAAARGIKGVWDYLSHDSSKDWTPDQIKAYHLHGIACGFLFETTANRALSGYQGGLADGRFAANELQGLIRMVGYSPATKLAVIFAIDFNATATQYPVIKAYMQGARDGLAGAFLTGAYGSAAVVNMLGALIDVAFQTYAWSGGVLSPRAALYQYLNGQTIGGAAVDFDRIIDPVHVGAWWPAGLEPAGGGTPIDPPTPLPKGTDMSFRMVQDPRSPAQWAMGDTWAIGMANGAEYAVWASDPDCVNPAAIYAPDPAHWDQKWRRMVLVQPADGKSLGDALTALIAPLVTAGSIDLASVASAASAGAQGGASAALNGATVTSTITKPAAPAATIEETDQ